MKAITTLAAIFLLQALNAQECVDIDGNAYATVQIGNQLWMAENLKTTRYSNGIIIPTGHTLNEWVDLVNGGYAVYEDEADNDSIYGKRYNWYTTIDSGGLCPEGWHIPSDQEWMVLESAIGVSASELNTTGGRGYDVSAGLQLKSPDYWQSNPFSPPGNNSSGFTALPAGWRSTNNDYFGLHGTTAYWTTTSVDSLSAFNRSLLSTTRTIGRYSNASKYRGYSCRCVNGPQIGFEEKEKSVGSMITVVPCPTLGLVSVITGIEVPSLSIIVRNTLGQPILTIPLNGNQRQTIDLAPYENGVYFVEVRYADGTRAVERIVKQ